MTIKFNPNSPQDTNQKLSSWLDQFNQAAAAAGCPEDVEFRLSQAYQVHHPSSQQINSGHLLCASRNSRWRHLVFAGDQAIGEIELNRDNDPAVFYQGPSHSGLLAALEQISCESVDYDFSIVLIPGLKFSALWLQSEQSDSIMPFEPDQTPLPNLKPHQLNEVNEVLAQLIKDGQLSNELSG